MLEETAFQQIFGHDAKMKVDSDNYYDPRLFMYPELARARSVPQSTARNHLYDLLENNFTNPDWFIGPSLLFIHKTKDREIYILPQICIFKGITSWKGVRSTELWEMNKPNRPAPAVMFEFVIDPTIKDDLGEKIRRYGQLGVSEYFAYDPHRPPFVKKVRYRTELKFFQKDGNESYG